MKTVRALREMLWPATQGQIFRFSSISAPINAIKPAIASTGSSYTNYLTETAGYRSGVLRAMVVGQSSRAFLLANPRDQTR
jgi:hypothetical protein